MGRIKAFIWGFAIAALLFTGLGYAWRMVQVEEDHRLQIAKLKEAIEHYRANWMPIKGKEARKK